MATQVSVSVVESVDVDLLGSARWVGRNVWAHASSAASLSREQSVHCHDNEKRIDELVSGADRVQWRIVVSRVLTRALVERPLAEVVIAWPCRMCAVQRRCSRRRSKWNVFRGAAR